MIEPPLTLELASGEAPKEVAYAWDEWDVQQYFYFLPEPFPEPVRDLTPCASWALTLAILEWVEAYLSHFSSDNSLEQYIAAGWVGTTDRSLCQHLVTDDDEWRGPVRGPMQLSLAIIAEMFFVNADMRTSAAYAIFAENLARHVLPDSWSFDPWYTLVTDRLNTWHSYSVEDPQPEPLFAEDFYLGKIVSRSLFNSSHDYDGSAAEAEMDMFIANTNSANPFLS